MTAYKVDKRSRIANNNSDSYEFNSANKLFVANDLEVRQCMLNFFGEELESLVSIHRKILFHSTNNNSSELFFLCNCIFL